MAETVRVGVRLDPEAYASLLRVADDFGVTVTALVQSVIEVGCEAAELDPGLHDPSSAARITRWRARARDIDRARRQRRTP